MADKPFTINLKKPEDSPQDIANKLNSLTSAINVEVIAGAVKQEDFDTYRKSNDKIVGGYEDRIAYNIKDGRKVMTGHVGGGGLAQIYTDSTLTGIGTLTNPLHVVAATGNFLTAAQATATYLPLSVATATYLPLSVATATYLAISATGNVLTTVSATATYLPLSVATATYLPYSVATSLYLSNTSATAVYLSQALATSQYLSNSSATATYVSQGYATGTYLSLALATSAYLPKSVATATYMPISVYDPATIAQQLVGTTATQTLTNKRISPRWASGTSQGPSINSDTTDIYLMPVQNVTVSGVAITGTPTEGQKLWLSITGTAAVALTLATSTFEASTVALPTTTVTTARLDMGFVWNTVTSKWRIVATS